MYITDRTPKFARLHYCFQNDILIMGVQIFDSVILLCNYFINILHFYHYEAYSFILFFSTKFWSTGGHQGYVRFINVQTAIKNIQHRGSVNETHWKSTRDGILSFHLKIMTKIYDTILLIWDEKYTCFPCNVLMPKYGHFS